MSADERTGPMVRCEGLVHIYRAAGLEVVALQGLDLRVERGEAVAMVGRSGSGKTTLMNILAGVDAPSAGTAEVAGWQLSRLGEGRRATYRRDVVGYVLQHASSGLGPELSALEDVQLPMIAAGVRWGERRGRARELLAALGVEDRAGHSLGRLSAGEQQRVALAAALANRPPVLLADEPTGQLDGATARRLLADLRGLQRELGTTIVIVTHDPQVSRHVDRVVQIRDGRTSTERRWVAESRAGGAGREEELVIMDRAGRLQLPRALRDAARLGTRVRLELHGRGILILPAGDDQAEERDG